jgi:hypothetical protein
MKQKGKIYSPMDILPISSLDFLDFPKLAVPPISRFSGLGLRTVTTIIMDAGRLIP